MTGTLQLYSGGRPSTNSVVTLIVELPGLVRLEDAASHRVVVFDGNQTSAVNAAVTKGDTDMVESFVYDTVEGFLLGQISGPRARLVARSIRLTDSRVANPLSGTCDLYELGGTVAARSVGERSTKTFCFDSGTSLLKVVMYKLGSSTIETRFGNWSTVGDQRLPGSITRLENDLPVFSFVAQNLIVSAKVADGLVSHP